MILRLALFEFSTTTRPPIPPKKDASRLPATLTYGYLIISGKMTDTSPPLSNSSVTPSPSSAVLAAQASSRQERSKYAVTIENYRLWVLIAKPREQLLDVKKFVISAP